MEYFINNPQLLWNIFTVIFGAGFVYAELRGVRKDISRLEEKQEESNNVKIKQAAMQAVIDMQQADIKEMKQILYANRELHQ